MKTQTQEPQGILVEVFGGVSAKILEFMSTMRHWDYSKHEIAEKSGVSPRHAVIALEKLERLELVKRTRNVGHAHMYQYNMDNEAAKLLEKFALTLAGQECEKEANTVLAEQTQEQSQIKEQKLIEVPA